MNLEHHDHNHNHNDKSCKVHGGVPLLSTERVAEHMNRLHGWELANNRLSKTYPFKDPPAALAFVNRVGSMAEAENHHPEIHWFKRNVKIEVWTHKADGLTERDFLFAAACDPLEHA